MKVKIGNKLYDGNKQPIMIILSQQDKENIKNMATDATKYCYYPEGAFNSDEETLAWMRSIPEESE